MERESHTSETTIITPDSGESVRATRITTPLSDSPGAYQKKKVIFRAYQILWYILGILEVLLGGRFLLKALAANPASGFVRLVYDLSEPFVIPFRGIFPPIVSNRFVFEWSTIVAMLVYALLVYGIVYLLQLVKPTRPDEVERVVEHP